MKEKKKDWLPIIIYISAFLGVQIIAAFIYGYFFAENKNISENKMLSITNIIIYATIAIPFIVIYYKKYIEDIKRLTKKDIITMIISMAILFGVNFGLSTLFLSLNVEMANQDMAESLLNYYKPLMIISLVLFGPIAVEIVYRYSIDTIAKNEIAFIIISSLAFGAIHGLGIVTILYVLMGVILAICYLKTNRNIAATTILHIINNALGVLMMIALIR